MLILTAIRTDREGRLEALRAGAEGFLSKPLDEIELVAQIRAMVKIKAANRHRRMEKEQLAAQVVERTHTLEGELAVSKRAEEALRQSKEFREIILNSMNDIISVIDVTNFKITEVNQVFLDRYGMKREEVIGKTCYEISHNRSSPCTPPDDICPLLDTLSTGKHSTAEHVHYTEEDEKIYVEVSTSPIRDARGKISQVVHTVRDITDRKRIEEEMRESEERFRILVETAVDAIIIADHEGNTVSWNHSAEIIFGYGKDEIIGRPLTILMPERFWQSHKEGMKRRDTTGEGKLIGKTVEVIGLKKNGEEFPLEISLASYQTKGKNFYAAILRDITQRKKIEAQLFESENRYRTAIEHSNDGVAIIRGDKHLYVNRRYLEIFGLERAEEVIGKTHSVIVHPDDLEKVMELNTMRQRGEPVPSRYECKGIRKDGTAIYLEISATGTSYRGEPVTLAYLRDITARKWNEAEREKLILELKETLSRVKQLSGMLPICASCKKIRDDKGYWSQVEVYIRDHSEAEFSHGICPDCMKKLYPDLAD